jgi:23S rRNA (guanine2445-N2)-methyltransferase / 23S rRNA (guanine2069-N7)-methyltransferase
MYRCIATAPRGTLELLTAELTAQGATDVRERGAQVRFAADLAALYRACLWSRVASRIYLELAEAPAPSSDALYRAALSIDWASHIPQQGTIAVDCDLVRSTINHSHFAALRVKDAIVDQLRERRGSRPDVDTARPSVRVFVRLVEDQAFFAIDLSGDSLHRRGYRAAGVAAPLKENLAAALLLRAGWASIAAGGGAFLDPLCGSGTLPIEAALIAANVAPGLGREWFGFLGWAAHEAPLWASVRAEAIAQRRLAELTPGRISGTDHDPRAVRAALAAVSLAGLHGHVHIERRELVAARPTAARGLMVTNPPYGERLGEERAVQELYRSLGSVLLEHFPGWEAAVLTGNPQLGRELGLRARRVHRFFNGPIECRLLRFEVSPEHVLAVRKPGELLPVDPAKAETAGARMFTNRLRKNLAGLGRWAQREQIKCYRLYDADMPEYAFAIDLYGGAADHACVQEYAAPDTVDPEKARARRAEVLAVLPGVLRVPIERIHLRTRRRQRGAQQYAKRATTGEFHAVEEGGLRFLVNFTDYLDTGLFLDHRLTRARLRDLAAGRRFLNLFAYTGTASVYAAAGGARATTSVDLSRPYLEWAERNMALNRFDAAAHRFVQADCLQYLTGAPRAAFDLVFLDPPTFSNSKRMLGTLDVQRDHVELIRSTSELLAVGGTLVFSTNHARFALDAASLPGLRIEDVSAATIPRDFARHARIHRCYLMERR